MNFALILFVLTLVTGAVWAFDRFYARKHRAPDAKEPWWVEYGASFFPVILIVFLLRSFLVEPFRIPSGSMIPTLLVGDFILVNKYTYGIRLPIVNRKIIELDDPKRGDVVVFRYPDDPSLDYIKRVIGVPGDKVTYRDKRLMINGQEVPTRRVQDYLHKDRLDYSQRYVEKLGEVEHQVLNDANAPAYGPQPMQFPYRDNCNYNSSGFICEVPPGHYFVMGDNRDHSNDSRVWGFVPDENIVGKAFLIWFNFGDLQRIGGFN